MLQIKNLTITHRKDLRVILENFNLTLNDGDKAVIIGEEGNGKSTLLSLRGAEHCRRLVQEETEKAIGILRSEFGAPDFLIWLTRQLAGRKN